MKSYIKGVYKKSIFSSEKGYIIGLCKVIETDNIIFSNFIDKTITFTGYFHELNEGDTYIFNGEEVEHIKYGLQFQVESFEKIKPEDKDGIIEFLSSDLFPKIGTKLATSIVEVLGEDALNMILEDPSCLNMVPKITQKKIDIIYNNLLKYDESHQTIVYLTELGFNMKDSLAIYNQYLKDSISVINNNIYKIIDVVDEISFLKIDEVAKKINMDPLDPRRIKAIIIYAMKFLTFNHGDTYLNYQEIYEYVCNYVHEILTNDTFENYLNELKDDNKIVVEERKFYLKDMFDAQISIVKKISRLLRVPKTNYKKLENYLENLEKYNEIKYNDEQKKAITKALTENILIITGGPGTGKTTIIKAIVELYQQLNNLSYESLISEIALLAPTGRASKRLSESTFLPATTIHRFLKWNKETNKFAINEYDKDNSKLIIVDEVSMLDESLFDSLLKGLTDNIKLILVGDYNQLSSVAPGQVLKDLIESEMIPVVSLEELYRQDENSYIPILAQEIKNNELSEDFLDAKGDYLFLECSSNSIRKNLVNICNQLIEKDYVYKNIQLMAPMYKGENGIDILNKDLQNVFNPRSDSKNEVVVGDVIFRENDKVLQLVNMPDENVFNGDIGVIKEIINSNNSDSGKTEIIVDFDSNLVKFLPKDYSKLKHGFIISIHKSQGSEFDMAIIPISKSYSRMLYRKLIYTGITRAKKKLILIGEAESFVKAVNNNLEMTRKTNLKEKLIIMNNNLK
ncbi:MAG: ATP-dependent RecD-like DNA helicase [Firmicutes bacterium]|nr:ATP-dependent RecD-like DNA helicase [Bacillota bacterium]